MLSALFAGVVRLRRGAYAARLLRAQRLPKPVIVVGNVSVGGTGKTPLVLWLVGELRALGLRPGVVLRGYGGAQAAADKSQVVQPDSDALEVGDEAVLLRLRSGGPVAVGRDRVSAARLLISAGADVIVADDGLQHLRLARDFEIAVVDATRGLGNGYLLPAGPLREPPARLASVNAVVLNGEGGAALGSRPTYQMRLIGEQLQSLSGESVAALASFSGRRVHALAGIGNPQRFFAHLAAVGIDVIAHPFPDHHEYRAAELEFGDGLPLLMTEKDAVKCRQFAAPDRWCLPVTASFAPPQQAALLAQLQSALQR